MKNSKVNSFNPKGGLVMDASPLQVPDNVYTFLENGTFITHEGNELILQNEKGTLKRTQLKKDYVPVSVKSKGEFAYIVSAECEFVEAQEENVIYDRKEVNHSFVFTPKENATYRFEYTGFDAPEGEGFQFFVYANDTLKFNPILTKEELPDPITLQYNGKQHIRTVSVGYPVGIKVTELTPKKAFVGFTGRGEIGSFPSPDYSSATLECQDCSAYRMPIVQEYSPIKNYKGDNGVPLNPTNFNAQYGDFNSGLFKFDSANPPVITALQEAYDKTINIFFTDGVNPPRVINTRFSPISSNLVKIEDRFDTGDDNLYDQSDFDSTIKQFISSNKLAYSEFKGQDNSGQLPCGVYRYFFTYITDDGNESELITETFKIPTFIGTTVANTRMSVTKESSGKANIIELHNIDTDFNSIRVYFAYATGQGGIDALTEYFVLPTDFPISNNSVEIRHNGFESAAPVDITTINQIGLPIDTYKTACEVNGVYFMGNITSSSYDISLLREFTKQITISHTTVEADVVGLRDATDNYDSIYQTINQTQRLDLGFNSGQILSYEGGYANPKNVHDYLGYWGAESYQFTVEYIFKDNRGSILIPVVGIDSIESANPSYDLTLLDNTDFDTVTGTNRKGIYRFPSRQIVPIQKWLFPKFNIPLFTENIKDLGVIGIRIHRAQRRLDCFAQGLVIETVPAPPYPIDGEPNGGGLHHYFPYTDSTVSFLPAFNFILEAGSMHLYESGENGGSINAGQSGIFDADNWGVSPFRMNFQHFDYAFDVQANIQEQSIMNNSYYAWRHAFISPEYVINKIRSNSQFDRNELGIMPVADVFSKFKVRTFFGNVSSTVNKTSNFSLIVGQTYLPPTHNGILTDVKSSWVEGFNAGNVLGQFTGKTDFVASLLHTREPGNVSDKCSYIRLNFNDYVGLYTEHEDGTGSDPYTSTKNGLWKIFSTLDPVKAPNRKINSFGAATDLDSGYYLDQKNLLPSPTFKCSALVNMYPRTSGPLSTENLNLLYDEIDQFTPITQKLYIDNEIAQRYGSYQLDGKYLSVDDQSVEAGQRAIIGVNGDCYMDMCYRRMFYNSEDPSEVDDFVERRQANLGYTLAFLSESNYNPYARDEFIQDIASDSRSFYPFAASSRDTGNRQSIGNPWRDSRAKETEEYNSALNKFMRDRSYISLGLSVPFVQRDFSTRIAYTNPYYQQSLINGYRTAAFNSFVDYPQHIGQITAIRNIRRRILSVHENGILILPINERIAQQGDGSGPVFFEASSVLPETKNAGFVSEIYGSKWRDSILATDNYCYGVDLEACKIWRTNGSGLEIMSDLKIQSLLRELKKEYENEDKKFMLFNIATYYDKFKGNVVFVFNFPDTVVISTEPQVETIPAKMTFDPSTNTLETKAEEINVIAGTNTSFLYPGGFCIIYNELGADQWVGTTSWAPASMFSINDKFYSTSIRDEKQHEIYQHYVNEKHNNMYDNQEYFILEYVVKDNPNYENIFNNIRILSNNVTPDYIEYETDKDSYNQIVNIDTVDGRFSELEPISSFFKRNASYREGTMSIVIDPNTTDLHRIDNFNNKRIRGKYCKIRLYYSTDKKLEIQAILTTITNSFAG